MVKTLFKPALAGLCLLFAIIGAQGAALTITTTADDGPGSLRQAIVAATDNAAENVVTFNIPLSDPGYDAGQDRFTITLASPLPSIPLAAFSLSNTQTHALTITGDGTFRIFTFVNSAVVTFNNLTISGGSSSDLIPRPERSRTRSSRKRAEVDLTIGYGGGIYMGDSGTLELINSVVTGNTASIDGGGIYMRDSAVVHISQTTISNNTAPGGNGGGIYIHDSGTLNMDSSTLSGNSAVNGGAIYNGTTGTINASSSTLDGNIAANFGGGIYNTATANLTNNTVTSNIAFIGGGFYNTFAATLNNNIVALNTATEEGSDLFGPGFAGTYNLIGNIDGSTGLGGAPNQSGTTGEAIDPMIGVLKNNGGLTFTRVPLFGSPAIDKGNSATLVLDQRGALRPVDNMAVSNGTGNGADIGAVEVQIGMSAADVTVSGHIYLSGRNCQVGLTGATVELTGMNGVSLTANTTIGGYYEFLDVPDGKTYIVTVASRSYTFDPQLITVTDSIANLDFATPAGTRRCSNR